MELTSHILISLVILFLTAFAFSESISCKGEKNQDVDWFINYKLPQIGNQERSSLLGQGAAYAYLASDSKVSRWRLSNNPVSSSSSMMGNTLSVYYDEADKQKLTYLFYNDELPDDETGSSVGHTKGALVFNNDSGFWLIHSIPKFPSKTSYVYPSNGYVNGQSVICITFDINALNELGHELLFNAPLFYAKNLSLEVESLLDDDVKSLFSDRPRFIRKAPFERITTVKSRRSTQFTIFAKDNQFHDDLYDKMIAPELKTSLFVETWRRGSGTPLDPSCGLHYSVLDIESVKMIAINGSKTVDIEFDSTEDHSKWAVSDSDESKWVCIGDINRMASQKRRGGGSACFQSSNVWSAFKAIVDDTDTCGGNQK